MELTEDVLAHYRNQGKEQEEEENITNKDTYK